MKQGVEEIYREIRETSTQSEEVLAFILTGSRGRGFENARSDYDCALIVKDESLEKYQTEYSDLPPEIDLLIFTLESFGDHSAWGSALAWDRYGCAHLKAEPDRTGGEVQQLIDEKSRVPAEHAPQFINGSLDQYINQVYRSIKCLAAGDIEGHRLEAAESVRPVLQALFCLHDRRVAPYYKYLRWELVNFPLVKLPLSGDQLVRSLLRIVEDGHYSVQQDLLKEIERIFRAEGFDRVFEEWQCRDKWAMTLVPE